VAEVAPTPKRNTEFSRNGTDVSLRCVLWIYGSAIPSVKRWEVLCVGSCHLCVRVRREQFAVLVRIPVGFEDRSNRTGLLLSSLLSCPRQQSRSHASVLPA
jgi:hypothetical protein